MKITVLLVFVFASSICYGMDNHIYDELTLVWETNYPDMEISSIAVNASGTYIYVIAGEKYIDKHKKQITPYLLYEINKDGILTASYTIDIGIRKIWEIFSISNSTVIVFGSDAERNNVLLCVDVKRREIATKYIDAMSDAISDVRGSMIDGNSIYVYGYYHSGSNAITVVISININTLELEWKTEIDRAGSYMLDGIVCNGVVYLLSTTTMGKNVARREMSSLWLSCISIGGKVNREVAWPGRDGSIVCGDNEIAIIYDASSDMSRELRMQIVGNMMDSVGNRIIYYDSHSKYPVVVGAARYIKHNRYYVLQDSQMYSTKYPALWHCVIDSRGIIKYGGNVYDVSDGMATGPKAEISVADDSIYIGMEKIILNDGVISFCASLLRYQYRE